MHGLTEPPPVVDVQYVRNHTHSVYISHMYIHFHSHVAVVYAHPPIPHSHIHYADTGIHIHYADAGMHDFACVIYKYVDGWVHVNSNHVCIGPHNAYCSHTINLEHS